MPVESAGRLFCPHSPFHVGILRSPPASDKLSNARGGSRPPSPSQAPTPQCMCTLPHVSSLDTQVPLATFMAATASRPCVSSLTSTLFLVTRFTPHAVFFPKLTHLTSEPLLIPSGTQSAFPPTSPESQVPSWHPALRPLPMPGPHRLGVTSWSEGPPGSY